MKHCIPVKTDTAPIRQRPRTLGYEKDPEVKEQVQFLVRLGLGEPGGGAWSSLVVLVWKNDQSRRLRIDYRRLNPVT